MSNGTDDHAIELTPARINAAIQQLLAARPTAKRRSVTAFELLDALWGPAAPGPDAWRTRQAAKARLVALLANMPGLTYVEGDA